MDNYPRAPRIAGQSCVGPIRCNDWRACPRCARIRQARVADAAARLEGLGGGLDWTTLEPIDPGAAALRAARDQWLAQAKPRGAVWTVEASPRSGRLHCNILTPPGAPPTAPLSYQYRICGVRDPRATAAYISKREQMPARSIYDGRLWGTAGPLWRYLSSGEAPEIVQAAAIQQSIDQVAGQPDQRPPAPAVACAADLSAADYRAIMARRCPDLIAATPWLARSPTRIGRGATAHPDVATHD